MIIIIIIIIIIIPIISFIHGKRFATNTYRKLALFLQKSPKVSRNLQQS